MALLLGNSKSGMFYPGYKNFLIPDLDPGSQIPDPMSYVKRGSYFYDSLSGPYKKIAQETFRFRRCFVKMFFKEKLCV
jgi:hypothetical protein